MKKPVQTKRSGEGGNLPGPRFKQSLETEKMNTDRHTMAEEIHARAVGHAEVELALDLCALLETCAKASDGGLERSLRFAHDIALQLKDDIQIAARRGAI